MVASLLGLNCWLNRFRLNLFPHTEEINDTRAPVVPPERPSVSVGKQL